MAKYTRFRFAPSPTGYLHLGAVRSIMFNNLMARNNGGSWLLRLEDTDRARLNKDAFADFMAGLETLNLLPKEGVSTLKNEKEAEKKQNPDSFYNLYQNGKFGPYIQSERLEIYHEHAQNLIDKRLCYWSFIDGDKKTELQHEKQLTKKPIDWYRESVKFLEKMNGGNEQNKIEIDNLLYLKVEKALSDCRKPALRFKLQKDEFITASDLLLGEMKFDLNLEEDAIFLKADGYPTYHLAHLIDDFLMKTSINIRGQEWIPSLPLHWVSYLNYWGTVIPYMHVPNILGETGNKKMSKRDGNVNTDNYLRDGFLPEALLNYLVFLGFNDGTDREIYLEDNSF